MDGPWDPGLQNERTGLAWQRTVLSGLTCSLLISRLLAELSITLAVVIGLAALSCTAGLGAVGILRFRQMGRALHNDRPIGGAMPQLLITALLGLTAVAALTYVIGT